MQDKMNHSLQANNLSIALSLLLAWCSSFFPSIINACTVSGGTYYFPISSLDSSPVNAQSFYQQHFGIEEITSPKKQSINIGIKTQTSKNVVLVVDVPNEYANKHVYLIFENKIELEKEDDDNQAYEKKSVFSFSELKYNTDDNSIIVLKQQGRNKYTFGDEYLSIKTHGEIIANEWRFLVIVKESANAESETLAIASINGESYPCDSRSIYVSTMERAKTLDAARTDGFYQYRQ